MPCLGDGSANNSPSAESDFPFIYPIRLASATWLADTAGRLKLHGPANKVLQTAELR